MNGDKGRRQTCENGPKKFQKKKNHQKKFQKKRKTVEKIVLTKSIRKINSKSVFDRPLRRYNCLTRFGSEETTRFHTLIPSRLSGPLTDQDVDPFVSRPLSEATIVHYYCTRTI